MYLHVVLLNRIYSYYGSKQIFVILIEIFLKPLNLWNKQIKTQHISLLGDDVCFRCTGTVNSVCTLSAINSSFYFGAVRTRGHASRLAFRAKEPSTEKIRNYARKFYTHMLTTYRMVQVVDYYKCACICVYNMAI